MSAPEASEERTSFTWKAQPKQKQFLQLNVDEALYGGAAGGGKSDTLIVFGILYGLKYPGAKILILRRTIAELQKEGSLIPRSLDILSNTEWTWREQKKKWLHPNGSVIEFGYCESESDVHQYQSAQYEVIIFDELTHFTEYQYTYMFSRCRSAKGYPAVIRSATNPGNVGHAWVKKRFVSIAPPGTTVDVEFTNFVTKKTEKTTRCFIPARVWDNQILMDNDPKYVLFLQNLPENERKALLEGDWDVFQGQYFGEWRYDKHVVAPFSIPEHWKRYICMDWGMAKPLACLWIAVDENGRAYVYREYYVTGKIASVAAEEIKAFYDIPDWMVVDRSIFSRKGEGPESIGATFKRILKDYQILPCKLEGKKPRINGWMKFREYLADAPDGRPWMQFFNTCPNAIRTIPEMIYDEKIVEDLNTELEDHAPDALRYFSVQKPLKADPQENKFYKDMPMRDQARFEREERAKKKNNDFGVDNFLSDVTI